MDTSFKGAYLTTEASVSYYNMKHIKNNQIVVRPTLDRVLLMVKIKFCVSIIELVELNEIIAANVHLLPETFEFIERIQ